VTDTQAAELTAEPVELRLEQYRLELNAYCYRMLGSTFEAEDAVQDTFLRAWRSYNSFEGRAAFRSWLYKVATNVCLDMLAGKERRARPIDLGPALTADDPLGRRLSETAWVEPIPDGRVMASEDPAETAEMRDTIRLAFIAALQHLAPKQRSVLILRDVLRWKASEVAELLGTTVASVNSALQRARATMTNARTSSAEASRPIDASQTALLALYVDAFERYDMDLLTSLLHTDAEWSMPPYELWLNTHRDITKWCLGPGLACRGSRLVPTRANGSPAFAQYKPTADGSYSAWSLQVIEISDGLISGICFFLDTEWLFPMFDLPLRLEGQPFDPMFHLVASD
jgi:RNA polymerase sigma-70 factor (ECF subfamily)